LSSDLEDVTEEMDSEHSNDFEPVTPREIKVDNKERFSRDTIKTI
jgi:hypothetical protein